MFRSPDPSTRHRLGTPTTWSRAAAVGHYGRPRVLTSRGSRRAREIVRAETASPSGPTLSFRALLLALAGSAVALLIFAELAVAAPYEDNDTPPKATRVVGDSPYDATFETENDEDWYVLNVGRRTQLNLQATTRTCGPDEYSWCGGAIELFDRQQEFLSGTEWDEWATGSLRYSVGPGTYYVRLTGGEGLAYRFLAAGFTSAAPVDLTLTRAGSRYPRLREAVTFGGSVSPAKPAVSIVVDLKGSDGVYRRRGTLGADGSSGRYSRRYKPSRRGLYRLRTRFSGDATHAAARSRSVYMRVR